MQETYPEDLIWCHSRKPRLHAGQWGIDMRALEHGGEYDVERPAIGETHDEDEFGVAEAR